ncbi:DUF2855 family protein [Solihabitans fulvus]|uniref:DUF2855 family protein n=1 Tax=Solihabitans fulvus TaxID=1892852 RepID=A0A5B2WVH5_9PSEU|nr:DUF2855 family protein [Solihabitans fulvus]KAA2255963.1 DUF2855 family protein [Solihabitans fulvus]
MTMSWTLAVARDDLSRTALSELAVPECGAGEALLRVDRVGVTANNVTYAVLGESFHYWDFFPAEPGWGHVPLWGFAEVVASAVDGVEVGARVYGYLPPAGHLVVRPDRVDPRGFRDASQHRAGLPSPYNSYVLTAADPAYEPDLEDLQVLYRPLFFTSYMLADQLADNGFHGADVLALSSASSKTAYGAAFLLKGTGPQVVGLTSPGNVAFAESLGCYDRVLTYDALHELDATAPTAYLDLAGNAEVRGRLQRYLGEWLVREEIIGVTHQDRTGAKELNGPRTAVFFAPNQLRKRVEDWGREELDRRFAEAWLSFVPSVRGWVDVRAQQGPEALRDVWLEVASGRSEPRVGNIVTF